MDTMPKFWFLTLGFQHNSRIIFTSYASNIHPFQFWKKVKKQDEEGVETILISWQEISHEEYLMFHEEN